MKIHQDPMFPCGIIPSGGLPRSDQPIGQYGPFCMGLPSTIGRTGLKCHVDGCTTNFPQANSPQPPGLLPCRSRVAPHGQQGAQ
ncbi:hypothetical protein ElyMa_006566000 [Elysia marginata]|uniref:Uncharacterized protein n=1 Tax=Elysia marginata TaxID=1093978 RepID=A0AAV4ICI2_9GAST|nr:hypothetical protein ElyMa_006566000 [Elysia marginata]